MRDEIVDEAEDRFLSAVERYKAMVRNARRVLEAEINRYNKRLRVATELGDDIADHG